MSYYVEVHPDVRDRLNADNIPQEVRKELARWLLQLEEDPKAGAYEDPVVGFARIFTTRHNDLVRRFVFALDVDDENGTVGVTQVAIDPPH